MRKQIETIGKSEVAKEVKQFNGEGSKMENLLKFYAKTFKRMSYTKDVDTDKQRMDYAECLQEVITNYLEKKPEVENLKYYLLRAAKNEMKDRYKKESRLDITDENFEAEIFSFNLGEVTTAREAIQKLLTVTEYEVVTLYGQGFTLDEIAVKIGVGQAEQSKRILFKARKKIDTLKMETMYNSKIAQYQGKQGKADIKYTDTVYNEKLDTYKIIEYPPSEAINRKFVCLDQNKVKTTLLPDNYSGNLCVNRKEAVVQIADALDKNRYSVTILNSQYMNSEVAPFENNKEVIQLFKNRSEYNKMVKSNCTMIEESRYNIEFGRGKYISTDHKYLDR